MADTRRETAAGAGLVDSPATVARYGAALVRDRDAQRRLRLAREAFISEGSGSPTRPPPTPIRNEILGSWRRSRVAELAPDHLDPPFESNEHRAVGLQLAARPVVDKLAAELSGTNNSIILTDYNGWIIDRWADTSALATILDDNRSSIGFSLREDVVGTNGLGTVIETRRPFQVCDAEHFASQYLGLTCAGAPIRHPISGRLEGVIDITCRFEDTNALLLPLVVRAAGDIEAMLYSRASVRERALLERFLAVSRGRSRPVLSLSEDMVIASASATRILRDVDIVSLWEQSSAATRDRRNTFQFSTRDGATFVANCQSAYEADELLGAVIDLSRCGATDAVTDPASPPSDGQKQQVLPGGLVGTSPAWRRVTEMATMVASHAGPCLIEGEQGTGKLALAQAIHELAGGDGPLEVIRGEMVAVDGLAEWVQGLRARLTERRGTIVLCHVDALDPVAAATVTAVLDAHQGPGPRLLATLRRGTTEPSSANLPLVNTLAAVRVVVPPLRDRPNDIGPIVEALTARHHERDHCGRRREPPRWRSDALQALGRHDWPDNVRELERVVRQIVLTHRPRDVAAADLPPELLARANGPFLGQLER
ncbi:MAG: sigma 54-interacting transcriptional regulator, partial [Acidimicrobiia bacterium]|nr:sigma 54-interacting transcriptional regulator [Acidimicrobiia bacterium]